MVTSAENLVPVISIHKHNAATPQWLCIPVHSRGKLTSNINVPKQKVTFEVNLKSTTFCNYANTIQGSQNLVARCSSIHLVEVQFQVVFQRNPLLCDLFFLNCVFLSYCFPFWYAWSIMNRKFVGKLGVSCQAMSIHSVLILLALCFNNVFLPT